MPFCTHISYSSSTEMNYQRNLGNGNVLRKRSSELLNVIIQYLGMPLIQFLSHLQMVPSSQTQMRTSPSLLKLVCRMAALHLG